MLQIPPGDVAGAWLQAKDRLTGWTDRHPRQALGWQGLFLAGSLGLGWYFLKDAVTQQITVIGALWAYYGLLVIFKQLNQWVEMHPSHWASWCYQCLDRIFVIALAYGGAFYLTGSLTYGFAGGFVIGFVYGFAVDLAFDLGVADLALGLLTSLHHGLAAGFAFGITMGMVLTIGSRLGQEARQHPIFMGAVLTFSMALNMLALCWGYQGRPVYQDKGLLYVDGVVCTMTSLMWMRHCIQHINGLEQTPSKPIYRLQQMSWALASLAMAFILSGVSVWAGLSVHETPRTVWQVLSQPIHPLFWFAHMSFVWVGLYLAWLLLALGIKSYGGLSRVFHG